MRLPRTVNKVGVPPIKCQGIKTKIVPLILEGVLWDGRGTWVEPFLGSGVVLFNARPQKAQVFDTNRHIISLYKGIQSGDITPNVVERFLRQEGAALLQLGEEHYYAVRERFNKEFDPLDFLFLNRACFNGMMRFNKKGLFNVPFCRKPERFRQAYITKICNQVSWVATRMRGKDWTFAVADWTEGLANVGANDFVYMDPPYVGRHADYYNQWNDEEADRLAEAVKELPSRWAYSMWLENRYRRNDHVDRHFGEFTVLTQDHFYHVGASESLRNPMQEALVVSADTAAIAPVPKQEEQVPLEF